MSTPGEGGKARAQAAGAGGKGPGGPKKDEDSKNAWIGCAGLLVIGLLIAFGVAQCGGDGGSAQLDEQVQRDDAKSACHKFVKDKLKAPSSAKFSDEDHTGTGGTYTFTGAVDSQNSFGAMIRATWSCDVHSSGDEWRGSATLNEGS